MNKSYEKVLTKNDTGETGGHQAGIVIPRKNSELLNFFPRLDLKEFNPSTWIICIDESNTKWKMRYVYYNGKTFSPSKSTRNEYRLTHMTTFFSEFDAKSGDVLVFTDTGLENTYKVKIKKQDETVSSSDIQPENPTVVLKGWRVVY